MEDIIIVICQGQIIIGEGVSVSKKKLCLKKPRVLQQISDPGSKTPKNVLMTYIGNPDKVYFNRNSVSLTYTPVEPNLIEAYVKTTSIIKVAPTMPKLPIPFNLKEARKEAN